jgi:hypothetical protein
MKMGTHRDVYIGGKLMTSVQLTTYTKCDYPDSKICGLDQEPAVLCYSHKAESRSKDLGRVIKQPVYGSLDEAAMVAANIIKYHMFQKSFHILKKCHRTSETCFYTLQNKDHTLQKDGGILHPYHVEYGISIYGKGSNKDSCNGYCLVETRLGSESEVYSDYDVGYGEYHFVATVHSHPISGIYKLSDVDYILACGGVVKGIGNNSYIESFSKDRSPYVSFLLGVDWSRAWSPNHSYKRGEVTAYDNKHWFANGAAVWGRPPSKVDSLWKEIKEFSGDDSIYKDGEIVYDPKEEYRFWKMDVSLGDWVPYEEHGLWTLIKFTPPAPDVTATNGVNHSANMLAAVLSFLSPSFTIPANFSTINWGYNDCVNIWSTLRVLHTKLQTYKVKIPPSAKLEDLQSAIRDAFRKESKHQIIRIFNGTLQQTDIVKDCGGWRGKWEDIL